MTSGDNLQPTNFTLFERIGEQDGRSNIVSRCVPSHLLDSMEQEFIKFSFSLCISSLCVCRLELNWIAGALQALLLSVVWDLHADCKALCFIKFHSPRFIFSISFHSRWKFSFFSIINVHPKITVHVFFKIIGTTNQYASESLKPPAVVACCRCDITKILHRVRVMKRNQRASSCWNVKRSLETHSNDRILIGSFKNCSNGHARNELNGFQRQTCENKLNDSLCLRAISYFDSIKFRVEPLRVMESEY